MFSLKQDDEDDTFRVKRTIGSSYNSDEDDVRKTKSALNATGDYKPPKWGMTGVTDDGMFDGLKKFQKREGLQVDGIMRPGGPTEKKLAARTNAAKQPSPGRTPTPPSGSVGIAEGEHDQTRRKTDIFGNPLPPLKHPWEIDERPSLDDIDGGLGLPKPTGEDRNRANETQIAVLPTALQLLGRYSPVIARSLPALIGLADEAARQGSKSGQESSGGAPAIPPIPKEWLKRDQPQQRQQADPPPPTPGLEPPDLKQPDRTESASEPVEMPDTSGSLPDVTEPTIFVFPASDPAEFGDGVVERKGNEATRKELERIRDYFRSLGWKHIAGGRFAADDPDVLEGKNHKIFEGAERGEYHIPGYGKAFEADTRRGGHFTDLTFEDDRERTVHIQSVDVDRNGKPTKRELDNAERIRRAEKNTDVLLIPKGAQLKRNRRF